MWETLKVYLLNSRLIVSAVDLVYFPQVFHLTIRLISLIKNTIEASTLLAFLGIRLFVIGFA